MVIINSQLALNVLCKDCYYICCLYHIIYLYIYWYFMVIREPCLFQHFVCSLNKLSAYMNYLLIKSDVCRNINVILSQALCIISTDSLSSEHDADFDTTHLARWAVDINNIWHLKVLRFRPRLQLVLNFWLLIGAHLRKCVVKFFDS